VTSQTDIVEAFAPAKINLFLHVGEKRDDGFHELESLVAFAEVGDALTFERSDSLTLSLDGPFSAGLEKGSDNLVLRAAKTLAAHAGRRAAAEIRLTKNLPVASGIGGGSADAAATLRGLARLWGLEVSSPELWAIAATLGSDVPVCIESRAVWMEGRGERITPAGALPAMAMVLVNPRVAVSTADAFRRLSERRGTGKVDHSTQMATRSDVLALLKTTTNDLEAPARSIAPVIDDVLGELARMPDVEFHRMSGSGATCFGLFEDDNAADMAAIALSHSHPQWWVQATRIAS
jgi:4-diphosphocytidyl-2-C-methyl-D-erythritol kinase